MEVGLHVLAWFLGLDGIGETWSKGSSGVDLGK
jgi:hypothetical protein